MEVGLVGTGAFGSLMALHMSREHRTHVWNRTPANIPAEVQSRCVVHRDLADLARQVSRVVVSLHGESAIREVFLGTYGGLDLLQSGTVVIDTSTTSPWFAEDMGQKLASKQIDYFDCPVAGGLEGARNGTLVTFAGGPNERWNEVREVLAAFSKGAHHLGPTGAGQIGKAINVLILGTTMIGLAEAMAVAERTGLDTQELVAALSKGTAQSWALDFRAMNMLKSEHSKKGTCALIARDLEVSLELANRHGVPASATEHAVKRYEDALDRGLDDADISAIIELYR